MSVAPAIEVRCPVGPRKLLMRIRQSGEKPLIVPGNLMELTCRHCGTVAKREDPAVLRVVHRYNVLGELIATEAVRPTADIQSEKQ